MKEPEFLSLEEPSEEYLSLDLNKQYTYLDYLKWTFIDRVELIKGSIVRMAAPNTNHQRIIMELGMNFYNFFKGKPCQYFISPFDVRLPIPKKDKPNTVVQPDLCVFCDAISIDEKGGNGVPDLIVEIVSPGNSKHDLHTKFNLYQEVGVKEYWIVQPLERAILLYELKDGKFVGQHPYTEGMQINSVLFPDFSVEVEDIFKTLL